MTKMAADIVSLAITTFRNERAARCIKAWWCDILQLKREKKAIKVIERFFFMVKDEVDKEIRERERQKFEKREKRRRQRKEADDNLLERIWLNTVKEAEVSRRVEEAASRTLLKGVEIKDKRGVCVTPTASVEPSVPGDLTVVHLCRS